MVVLGLFLLAKVILDLKAGRYFILWILANKLMPNYNEFIGFTL